jgi:hypothetical protein
MIKIISSTASFILLVSSVTNAATVAITAGTYTQNFDSLGVVSVGEPLPGWLLRNGATATTMGSAGSLVSGMKTWADTGGGFKNVSSNDIDSGGDAAAQNANTNRALSMRQVNIQGNPGMSVNFNFSSTGVLLDTISFDLLMLNVAAKSTTFNIQYGLGASPSSFVSLGSWADPGVLGSTSFTFDRSDFGSDLDGKTQVWLRIVALQAATGTGNVYDAVGIDDFSISASAVPEPSAMLLGAIGVVGMLRRRR